MDSDDEESPSDQFGLKISSEMKDIFEKIKNKIKNLKHLIGRGNENKLSNNARDIFKLLSNNSRKYFERKIKRFSEQEIISRDHLKLLSEIIDEMTITFMNEYEEHASSQAQWDLNSKIMMMNNTIEFGKEIAMKYDINGYSQSINYEKKKWKEEDNYNKNSDEYFTHIDQNDLQISKLNKKLSMQAELENKLNLLMKAEDVKKCNMMKALNFIKKELKELKRKNKKIDIEKVIFKNLSDFKIDYTSNSIILDNSEEMKEIKFQINDRDREISKIVKDKFTIVYQENIESIEICTTHNGIKDLLDCLKFQKIPFKVRKIQLSIVQKIEIKGKASKNERSDNEESNSDDDYCGHGLRDEDNDDEEIISSDSHDVFDDEEYSDEDDDKDKDDNKGGDFAIDEHDEDKFQLINMIKSFPETLEGFTFANRDKNNPSNLEEKYEFTKFIVALIKMGINELGFSNISFNGDGENSNQQTLKNIFLEACINSISYLKFNNCSGVTSLDKIFNNLYKLQSLDFNQCDIYDNDLDKIFEMIKCFGNKHMNLHLLSMDYNNITDEGIKDFTDKICSKGIHIDRVNVYYNKIEEKKFFETNRIYFC